jgi:micrococcal nuclease
MRCRSSTMVGRAGRVLLTAATALLVAACSDPSTARSSTAPGTATVVRSVDGDTIEVRIGGRGERVRLLGIDTPETKDLRRPVQCFGKEASEHTAQLLPRGTVVRIERDVEARDRYGRLLAYVFRVTDGLFVNLDLAGNGYAALYTYPPNVAHVDELRAAVEQARTANLGLWGRCGGPGKPAR